MKRKLIAVLTASLLSVLFSCTAYERSTQEMNPNELELIAPNGGRLADSKQEVMNWIEMDIQNKFGTKKVYTLTSIEYFEVEQEVICTISYRLQEGGDSNFIVKKGNPSSRESKSQSYIIACSGDACCTLIGTLTDSGIEFTCSCDNCAVSYEAI